MQYQHDSTSSEEKQVLNIITTAEELIIAMMIGDGYSRGKKNKYLEFCHCLKQTGYAEWKLKLLKQYVHSNTSFKARFHVHGQVRVTTPCTPAITDVYNRVYIDGRKQISREILDKINPLGVAIWFMDDGSVIWKRKNKKREILLNPFIIGVDLSTNSFSLTENQMIKEWFLGRFNIRFRIIFNCQSCTYSIRITTRGDVDRFLNLVSPFIMQVPCMLYKIGVFD